MRKASRPIRHNTPEEEAAIQRGIALDPENPEWTDEDWARARPAIEVCPEIVEAYRRSRGPNKNPTKEAVSLRLSQEVLEFFRATGRGWQTRLNAELIKLVRRKKVA